MNALYMMLSAACIAILGLLAKWDQAAMPLSLAVLLRLLVPMMLLLPFVSVKDMRQALLHGTQVQWWRALFSFGGQYCLFASIEKASLLNAILLYNTAPLFIPLLAALVYRERLSHRALISAVIGFVGIALVLHPRGGGLNAGAWIGLASGFFMASSQICLYNSSQTEKLNANMFSVYALSSCFALIVILLTHPTSVTLALHLTTLTWLALLGMSIASLGNQVFRYWAYKGAHSPSHLAPFMYFAVLLSGLLDWLFFQETPSVMSCFGALLVLIAIVIVTFNKRRV